MTAGRSSCADAFRARNDSIRVLYEDTPVPVREIARLVGRHRTGHLRAGAAAGLPAPATARGRRTAHRATGGANGAGGTQPARARGHPAQARGSGQRDKARAATQTALSMAADARVADRSLGEAPSLATNSSLRGGARARCGPRRPACPHPPRAAPRPAA